MPSARPTIEKTRQIQSVAGNGLLDRRMLLAGDCAVGIGKLLRRYLQRFKPHTVELFREREQAGVTFAAHAFNDVARNGRYSRGIFGGRTLQGFASLCS